jgi:hypothetical protein
MNSFDNHIPAPPPVSTIRAAKFNVFFTPKRHSAAATAAGSDCYFG